MSSSSVTSTVMRIKGCFLSVHTPLNLLMQTSTSLFIFFTFFFPLFCKSPQRPCSCTPHIIAVSLKSSVSVVHSWIGAGELHKHLANKLKVAFLNCQKAQREVVWSRYSTAILSSHGLHERNASLRCGTKAFLHCNFLNKISHTKWLHL